MTQREMARAGIWGKHGYPQITPRGMWYAVTVYAPSAPNDQFGCAPGAPFYTQIYPNFDDPLHKFTAPADKPWLTKDQCRILDAYWSKDNVGLRSTMRRYDAAYWRAIDAAEYQVREEEPLLRHVFHFPGRTIETSRFGYLPKKHRRRNLTGIASEIAERERARERKDFATADLIRKVIEGGGVRVIDFPTGSGWIFAPCESTPYSQRFRKSSSDERQQ